ncbi:hypothetical protein [Promicromonospora sp. NPDC050880]|uniref:hypothetical protein n=1 Tax=Promicromonospora sp. NPDC050880 TaxID=3364406 RepID=UPI0037A8CA79
MAGSGRLHDRALGDRWEQSLVGVTGAARRRRARGVRTRTPYLAARERAAVDSNRLRQGHGTRRRLAGSAIVLGAGLMGCTAVLLLSPAAVERSVLGCPAGSVVTVAWVDRYRDVLGVRVPDPRDRVEVAAPAGSTVEVVFTDAAGATYPAVRGEVSVGGLLAVEPPRPVPAQERGLWRVETVVVAGGAAVATCAGALP